VWDHTSRYPDIVAALRALEQQSLERELREELPAQLATHCKELPEKVLRCGSAGRSRWSLSWRSWPRASPRLETRQRVAIRAE